MHLRENYQRLFRRTPPSFLGLDSVLRGELKRHSGNSEYKYFNKL